jgi:hypothetical protein
MKYLLLSPKKEKLFNRKKKNFLNKIKKDFNKKVENKPIKEFKLILINNTKKL